LVSKKRDARVMNDQGSDSEIMILTTSPTKGHVMKTQPVEIGGVEIYRSGTIIGKALEPLESGTGLIEVFMMQEEER